MKWLKNRAIIYKFGAVLMIVMRGVFVVKAFRF